MKKSIFMSVAAFGMIVAMTSCGEKKDPQVIEEAIVGTDYVLVTTPDGAMGVKKGEDFVIQPKTLYANIAAEGGMFVAEFVEGGYSLIDPDTGYEAVSADTLVWKDGYFEGQSGKLFVVYIPASKVRFAADSYATKGDYAISTFNGKIAIWKGKEQIVEPNGEYSKIAILPDGKLIVLNGKSWGTATIKDKAIVPGKLVSAKDLKKFKAMKGWDDKVSVMILEQ